MGTVPEKNKFLYPRSYAGRAVFYMMFLAPAVYMVLCALRHFLYALFKASSNLYCYVKDIKEEPRITIYTHLSGELESMFFGFIHHLGIEAGYYVFSWFNAVFSLGVFAMASWFAIRFRKNGAFGAVDWFRTFAYAGALFGIYPAAMTLYGHIDGITAEPLGEFLFGFGGYFESCVFWGLEIFAFYYAAKFLFLKIPYDCEPLWKNEYPAREFIGHNAGFILGFLNGLGLKKILLILGAVFLYEFIYWFLLSV